MRLTGNDEGALGIPGILKVAVALGVIALLGYDGFVTVATHLKAENDAQNAAYAASQAWLDATPANRTPETAYEAAVNWIAANDPSDHVCMGDTDPKCGNKGLFSVDPNGTVHLVIRREADTILFRHIGFMHSALVAFEQGDANQAGN